MRIDALTAQFAPLHCFPSDFYGQNILRSTGDSTYSTLHVSRKTADGYIDITDRRLRIKTGGAYDERVIDDAALLEVLSRHFDVEICAPCAHHIIQFSRYV